MTEVSSNKGVAAEYRYLAGCKPFTGGGEPAPPGWPTAIPGWQ
jgi:hypothetical protein